MKAVLSAEHFHNEEAAFAYVEAHLWPNGPICPFCSETVKIGRLQGKTTRAGLRKCYACGKPFTVRIGTVLESSHVPLRIWLQVIQLICASKKGISTRQIQRTIGGSMKTAWFLGHRIREAMNDGSGPLGGAGKIVEADETFIANSQKTRRGPGRKAPKALVVGFAERGGAVRSRWIDQDSLEGVRGHLRRHVHPDSRLVTDQAAHYKMQFRDHKWVNHAKGEYVRGDVHTNTLEGFFSIFKRGLIGIYQHIDEKHFDCYLAEFDFRQNTRAKLGIDDVRRAGIALKGAKGKRLTYTTSHSLKAPA